MINSEINDISEILSFSSKKDHSCKFFEYSEPWWSVVETHPSEHLVKPSPELIKKYLHTYPDIFLRFRTAIDFQGEIHHINEDSNDVICSPRPECVDVLSNYIKSIDDTFNNLVIAGSDHSLSENIDMLRSIKHRFRKIYYEAKDIECNWVQTIPMGMVMAYMLRSGGNDILSQINKQKSKTKLIASAFGSRYPLLTERISDRSELKKFTSDCKFMDDMFCEPHMFYKHLCDYKFFASPLGNGLQTPKICESIMCETVPVVTDHIVHRELRDVYELPLLIVNKWTDITEEFLNDQWNSKYSGINWVTQKSKFLVNNFDKLLI